MKQVLFVDYLKNTSRVLKGSSYQIFLHSRCPAKWYSSFPLLHYTENLFCPLQQWEFGKSDLSITSRYARNMNQRTPVRPDIAAQEYSQLRDHPLYVVASPQSVMH